MGKPLKKPAQKQKPQGGASRRRGRAVAPELCITISDDDDSALPSSPNRSHHEIKGLTEDLRSLRNTLDSHNAGASAAGTTGATGAAAAWVNGVVGTGSSATTSGSGGGFYTPRSFTSGIASSFDGPSPRLVIVDERSSARANGGRNGDAQLLKINDQEFPSAKQNSSQDPDQSPNQDTTSGELVEP